MPGGGRAAARLAAASDRWPPSKPSSLNLEEEMVGELREEEEVWVPDSRCDRAITPLRASACPPNVMRMQEPTRAVQGEKGAL